MQRVLTWVAHRNPACTDRSTTRSPLSAIVVLALLAALAACGGGGGEDDATPALAAAASADIDSAGGSLEATLEGGTKVRLTLPAGALASKTTIRIDPVAAPQGSLGAFELSPAGIDFAVPAQIDIRVAGAAPVTRELTLAFERDGNRILHAATVDTAARTVSVLLSRIAPADPDAPARTAALAAGRSSEAFQERLELILLSAAFVERVEVLEQLVQQLSVNGSRDSGINVHIGVETVMQFSEAQTEPRVRAAMATYRRVVCDQRDFARSALDTFVDGGDPVGFMRRVQDMLVWGFIAELLREDAQLLTPPEGDCGNLPPTRDAPVRARFPVYLDLVRANLALLDPKADFTQILTGRVRALLNAEAGLQGTEVQDLLPGLRSITEGETVRLREGAYRACTEDGNQALHRTLLLEEAGNVVEPISPYSEDDLHADIVYCGMPLRWELRAADGTVLRSGSAGGLGAGVVASRVDLSIDDADRLFLIGPLRALHCPVGSQNNEQLVAAAGPASGALTNVFQLTPAGDNTYLSASPAPLATASLRTLAGIGGRLVVTRAGGECNGEFVRLQNPASLVTFNFVAQPQASDSDLRTLLMRQEVEIAGFAPGTARTVQNPDLQTNDPAPFLRTGTLAVTAIPQQDAGFAGSFELLLSSLSDSLTIDPVTGRLRNATLAARARCTPSGFIAVAGAPRVNNSYASTLNVEFGPRGGSVRVNATLQMQGIPSGNAGANLGGGSRAELTVRGDVAGNSRFLASGLNHPRVTTVGQTFVAGPGERISIGLNVSAECEVAVDAAVTVEGSLDVAVVEN